MYVEPLHSLVNFVLFLRRGIFGCADSGSSGGITVDWLPKDGTNRCRNESERKVVYDEVRTVRCKKAG